MPVIEIRNLNETEASALFLQTDAQLRNKQQPEQGVLIAEGPKVVRSALDAGLVPLAFLIRKKFLPGLGAEFISRAGGVPVYTGEDEVLSALTGFRLQRAWILCVLRRPKQPSPETVLSGAHRIAVLENLNDPSNVGALFRSAAALGMDGVLLSPSCADPFHRRAVRVCMGAVFQLPFAYVEKDLLFPLLNKEGFVSLALALRKNSVPLDDPSLRACKKTALFLGNEDTGLTEFALSSCDKTVTIPMRPGIDSLNVAAAAAVAFWELGKNDF